jgi:CBS domain-containing protein
MKTLIPVSSLLHHKGSTVWQVAPEATVFDAIKLMAEKNIGALPVISHGMLIGIFTERDYTRKIALQGKTSRDTRVQEVLSGEIICVTPNDSVEDCMKLMTDHRIRHLPVMQDDHLLGIISIGDLVNWIISSQNSAIEQMEQYIAGGVSA